MKINVFQHESYREFLLEALEQDSRRGRRTRLADAAGCQLSYLSQVLSGHVQLTEDQGFGIARYLRLKPVEEEYFLLLLRAERASSSALRSHLRAKLEEIREQQEKVSGRIAADPVNPVLREQYYSAWYYSAVHIALSIPQLRTEEALCRALNIERPIVQQATETLEQMGLIQRDGIFYKTVAYDIHVPGSSPVHINYNLIWRTFMCQRLQAAADEDLNYTAIQSLSRQDAEKLRTMILDFIESSRKMVSASAEEQLVALIIDYAPFRTRTK